MDGRLTFSTWDAASQHVTDKVVTQFGGTITVGEVDPANVGRDAVRQYYDAIETSDAIGNYGVDTTIANYAIHTITLGACPVLVNNVFLCYSKFQGDPGTWSANQALQLMSEGYWAPMAVIGNLEGGTNIGAYHLVCNVPSTALVFASSSDGDSLYIGADGTRVGGAAAGMAGYYPVLG